MDFEVSNVPYPNRGRGRQFFIKGVSLLGLALYVPALLIVLFWPGLAATGAKKMLKHEVNERFEKVGGLAATLTGKAAGLRAKFDILQKDHARHEEKMLEYSSFVSKNAGRFIAHFVNERTEQVADSGEIPNRSHPKIEKDPAKKSGAGLDPNANPDDGATTKSWASSFRDRLTSRIKSSTAADTLTTGAGSSALMVNLIYGPGGMFEEAVKRPGVELERLKKAIYEKYDITLRELVRELRIFTGSNVLIFAILWFGGGSARRARKLFPLAILLLAITLFVSYMYLKSSDWIYIILHRSYMGWGFLGLVLIVFVYVGHDAMLMALMNSDDDLEKTGS